MSDSSTLFPGSSSWHGIHIIPSEDVPTGYRRTEGTDIFINPTNYEYMRPLSAKGTLLLLGFLSEIAPVDVSADYNWTVLDDAIEKLKAIGINGDVSTSTQ